MEESKLIITWNTKGLSKIEKFVCEITWGNIPQDTNWIRNSKLFIGKMKEFEEGKFKELFEQEIKNKNNEKRTL